MPSPNMETPRNGAPRDMKQKMIRWRRERGLTQADLAERAGVSLKTVQRFENGALPSAHTAMRVQCALDLELDMEDEQVAPEWILPGSPHGDTYGSRTRALRLALGMSLDDVARACGISAATLSRFERDVSIPHGWIVEWVDEADRDRDALCFAPLARALGFERAFQLHEFCRTPDLSWWLNGGLTPERKEQLASARFHVDPELAYPADHEEIRAGGGRWLSKRRKGEEQALPRR